MMHEIKLYTDPRENFTPAGLMKRYADQTADAEFSRGPLSEAQLTIGGTVYRYDHWGMTREGGRDCVMLYLRSVGA